MFFQIRKSAELKVEKQVFIAVKNVRLLSIKSFFHTSAIAVVTVSKFRGSGIENRSKRHKPSYFNIENTRSLLTRPALITVSLGEFCEKLFSREFRSDEGKQKKYKESPTTKKQ